MLAVVFNEPGAPKIRKLMAGTGRLFAANLLEAEARSACARTDGDPALLEPWLRELAWVHPGRPLAVEMHAVLRAGWLRGADLWHLAVALSVRSRSRRLAFVTLDRRQSEVAAKLGFPVPAARWMSRLVSGAGAAPASRSTRRGSPVPSRRR